tara:strand:- start:4844 stop:5347 length:504 start_codon:yes stop_codon:yes gene_type:complete
MTPTERKEKVLKLKEEHISYFNSMHLPNAVYIPKMAYRPGGKDELHVSFFPSELQKEQDIYTEFVSIDYDTEDPKRTLYLIKYNPHWKDEYEMITSNSGFERHIIPVSELKVINDVVSRGYTASVEAGLSPKGVFNAIPNPETERDIVDVLKGIEKALLSINQKLIK